MDLLQTEKKGVFEVDDVRIEYVQHLPEVYAECVDEYTDPETGRVGAKGSVLSDTKTLFVSIKKWNLTDNGKTAEITFENVARLPLKIRNALLKKIMNYRHVAEAESKNSESTSASASIE